MNARETNRPGGRGRARPNVRSRGGGKPPGDKSFLREAAGCAVLALAVLALPAALAVDAAWRWLAR